MPDPTLPKVIADVPRGATHQNSRKPLTRAQLEEVLSRPLEGDDQPHQPIRRNLQNRLDNLIADEERKAQVAAMSPQEIVDTIPRHF